jgi:hypothetical protein
MTRDFIKALLINAAYQGASAVCEPIGEPGASATGAATGGLPIDPLIQDAGLQNKGVMVYEEAKIQYAAIIRAFEDQTGVWPDPKVTEPQTSPAGPSAPPIVNVASLAGQLASAVSAALPANQTLASVADLVKVLTTLTGPGSGKTGAAPVIPK